MHHCSNHCAEYGWGSVSQLTYIVHIPLLRLTVTHLKYAGTVPFAIARHNEAEQGYGENIIFVEYIWYIGLAECEYKNHIWMHTLHT